MTKGIIKDLRFFRVGECNPITYQPSTMTGYCAICGFRLTRNFPEDFPKKWKFCCACFELAKKIVYSDYNLPTPNNLFLMELLQSRIFKIRQKITLVK